MTASAYREKHITPLHREHVLIKHVRLDELQGNDQGHRFYEPDRCTKAFQRIVDSRSTKRDNDRLCVKISIFASTGDIMAGSSVD